jgi:hypothetical protein
LALSPIKTDIVPATIRKYKIVQKKSLLFLDIYREPLYNDAHKNIAEEC